MSVHGESENYCIQIHQMGRMSYIYYTICVSQPVVRKNIINVTLRKCRLIQFNE